MASLLYTTWKRDCMNGVVNLTSADKYVCLLGATYTNVMATAMTGFSFRAAITTYETAGTGYTAGGAALTTLVVTADLTNNLAYWSGANVAWATATVTARGAVVYKSTGNSATDPIICWFDFGSDQTATAGTFTIQWSTAGIIKLS